MIGPNSRSVTRYLERRGCFDWRNNWFGLRPLALPVALVVLMISANANAISGLDARPVNLTCTAFARPGNEFNMSLEPAFDDIRLSTPVVMAQSTADLDSWYVAELGGEVQLIRSSAGEKTVALDIRDRVARMSEGGLLGLALHPNFVDNARIYVSYTSEGPDGSVPFVSVISSFRSDDGGSTFDPSSEEIVIEIDQPTTIHNGGEIHFGDDGFLYVGLGDGGLLANGQDTGTLLSSFLRLDVDSATPYAVPEDNPFIAGGDSPEIWAYGVRNPYRWSFDMLTGDLWAGDVGASTLEEIDVIERAGNYGWARFEGTQCLGRSCDPSGFIEPVLEYSREAGCAVIGGYVYRGTLHPALAGAYIYGDFCSSRVWAAVPEAEEGYVVKELLTSPEPIFAFGQDSSGEIYVLGRRGIDRLAVASSPPASPLPALLSATGCVSPSDPREPVAGLIPYGVNEPFWSDGAAKRRWIALPEGRAISVAPDGDLELPIGSVVVKDFSIAERMLETRLFMRHDDGGWAGYTYVWNEDSTEAALVSEAGQLDLGGQLWTYPSREQCMACHTFGAGYTLGLEIAQLNRDFYYSATGRTANQIETLSAISAFDTPVSEMPGELPALRRGTLNEEARSYLHANCSNCHRLPWSSAPTNFDLRASAVSADLKLCDSLPQNPLGFAGERRLVPGEPDLSHISVRMHLLGAGQMPPLARSVVDVRGTDVIDRWIGAWRTCDGPDSDFDEVVDEIDNCPHAANPVQADANNNGIGDRCEATCNDGVDNDLDGLVDFPMDPGCDSLAGVTEAPECDDGLDNDGDGLKDGPFDLGCNGRSGKSEVADCDDEIDNDGDGLVDYPDDAGCLDSAGRSEVPEPAFWLNMGSAVACLALLSRRRQHRARRLRT